MIECFFFLSVCEQAAEFSKSCNLIGFVILYELLCRSWSFPPLLIFGFTSESRPLLKWYCLLYLDFRLHNNWPLFFFFHPASLLWTKDKRSERGKKEKLVYTTGYSQLVIHPVPKPHPSGLNQLRPSPGLAKQVCLLLLYFLPRIFLLSASLIST